MPDLGYSAAEARCGRVPSSVLQWTCQPSVIGKHKLPSLMTPCLAPGVTCLPPDEFPLIRPSLLLLLVYNSLYCRYSGICRDFLLPRACPNSYLCSTIISLYAQPSVSYIVKKSFAMSECVTHSISLLTHVLVSSCNNVSRPTEMMPTHIA